MIDLDEARRRAQRALDGTSGIPLVIAGVQAFGDGWVFFCDSSSTGLLIPPSMENYSCDALP
jgi:hypothetical protein